MIDFFYNKYFLVLIGFVCSFNSFAQQNLFNVPNSEITTHNDHFFQQQINFSPQIVTTQLTYDYGLGNDFEAGVNLYNLSYDTKTGDLVTGTTSSDDGSTGTMALLNFQKGLKIKKNLYLGIGSQSGRIISTVPGNKFAHYEYVNLEFRTNSHLMGVIGLYNANEAYQGSGQAGHLQLGVEAPLIEKKLHFVGDTLTGKTNISQTTIGFCYFPTNKMAISLGEQFSWRNNLKQSATVFEITILPDINLM